MKKVSVFLMLAMLVSAVFSYAPAASAATTVDNMPAWTKCADEQGVCDFTGTKEVRYGTDGSYFSNTATDGIGCSNEEWGDPAPLQSKHCDARDLLPEGTPSVTGTLDDDFKTFTIRFDRSIAPSGTPEQLKSAITIKQAGSAEFEALGEGDSVAYDAEDPDAIVLTLDQQLVGDRHAVRIAAGAVVLDGETEPYTAPIELSGIVGADIVPPAFIGAESLANGGSVKLHFDEAITPVFPDTIEDEGAAIAYLQSQIQVAQDGEHFSPLVNDLIEVGGDNSSIQISYRNDLKIVSGPKTKFKLAAGLFKDAAGNMTPELILDVSPPAIQSAALSSDNHDVTVTFDRNIYTTPFYNASKQLNSRIWLKEGSGHRRDLGTNDTVEVVGDKLNIHFATALNGESSQIVISGGTLQDANGNYYSDEMASPYLPANPGGDTSDTAGPEYINYLLSSDLKQLTLQFNEKVAMSQQDLAAFKQNFRWYNSQVGYVNGLPSDATVTVSGQTVIIYFNTLIDENVFYVRFDLSKITDLAGNYSDYGRVWTNWIDVNNDATFGMNNANIGFNGRFLSLYFEAGPLEDLTVDENGSHLKEKIKISTDNGVTFNPLSTEDKVILSGSSIGILLHNRIVAGTMQVEIDPGVLTDSHHYLVNVGGRRTITSNRPQLSGYLFSDADTALKFENSPEWRNHIQSVKVWDYENATYRELTKSEYDLTDSEIKIHKGVFLKDRSYEIAIESEGYSTQYYDGYAYKSSDLFYMTAPSISKKNGVTAEVFIYNRAYGSQNSSAFNVLSSSSNASAQDVVFELFDGDTPVSIVAAELAVGTGKYTAKFSVSDAALTSKNYTVKAFIVSSFDGEMGNVGLNLGTVKTQLEIDEAMVLSEYNDDRD
ncbi:hemoblobin-interacting domain-containing protein [Cohnella sp. GCM10020058]|uniref:hemoblobin-interacting domain-containing protein n=1 Tax=Cohnella sp. GCM10020058 TaxID=3317330 RepID=UPI00363D5995